METKHTPGPWEAYGLVIRDVDGGEDQVAQVMDGFGHEEDQANARLIASAPELLDALRDLLEAAEEAWPSDRPCVRIAREAIAKATGA